MRQRGDRCGVVARMLKKAYADGIRGAVNAYWNWQEARDGKPPGSESFLGSNAKAPTLIGCPSPPERCGSSPTAAISRAGDRDRRTDESTRGIERLIRAGRARALAIASPQRHSPGRQRAGARPAPQRPAWH